MAFNNPSNPNWLMEGQVMRSPTNIEMLIVKVMALNWHVQNLNLHLDTKIVKIDPEKAEKAASSGAIGPRFILSAHNFWEDRWIYHLWWYSPHIYVNNECNIFFNCSCDFMEWNLNQFYLTIPPFQSLRGYFLEIELFRQLAVHLNYFIIENRSMLFGTS